MKRQKKWCWIAKFLILLSMTKRNERFIVRIGHVGLDSNSKNAYNVIITIDMGGDMMIPQEPIMLLSFVNLKLRDYYSNLDAMCDDLDISKAEVEEKLKEVGYVYDEQLNKFV